MSRFDTKTLRWGIPAIFALSTGALPDGSVAFTEYGAPSEGAEQIESKLACQGDEGDPASCEDVDRSEDGDARFDPASAVTGGRTPSVTERPGPVTPRVTERPGPVTPRVTERPGPVTPRVTERPGPVTPRVTERPGPVTPRVTERPGPVTGVTGLASLNLAERYASVSLAGGGLPIVVNSSSLSLLPGSTGGQRYRYTVGLLDPGELDEFEQFIAFADDAFDGYSFQGRNGPVEFPGLYNFAGPDRKAIVDELYDRLYFGDAKGFEALLREEGLYEFLDEEFSVQDILNQASSNPYLGPLRAGERGAGPTTTVTGAGPAWSTVVVNKTPLWIPSQALVSYGGGFVRDGSDDYTFQTPDEKLFVFNSISRDKASYGGETLKAGGPISALQPRRGITESDGRSRLTLYDDPGSTITMAFELSKGALTRSSSEAPGDDFNATELVGFDYRDDFGNSEEIDYIESEVIFLENELSYLERNNSESEKDFESYRSDLEDKLVALENRRKDLFIEDRPDPLPLDLRFSDTSFINDRNGESDFRWEALADPGQSVTRLWAHGNLDALLTPFDMRAPDDGETWQPPSLAPAATQLRVDRFNTVTGLALLYATDNTPAALWGADLDASDRVRTARTFLPDETWTDLDPDGTFTLGDLADRGVWVVHPEAPSIDISPLIASAGQQSLESFLDDPARLETLVNNGAESPILHADFALRGTGAKQASSISATIGAMRMRFDWEDEQFVYESTSAGTAPRYANFSFDALLSANTVGSSRAPGEGSTLSFGKLASSAAGGGNDEADLGDGQMEFFVAQNAGLAFRNPEVSGPLPGGTLRPMGQDSNAPDRSFGVVRLGVATTPNDFSRSAVAEEARLGLDSLEGFAAGLVEVETAGATSLGLANSRQLSDAPNLSFSQGSVTRDANHVAATLTINGQALSFGGAGASAYVNDTLWGMIDTSDTATLAVISGETVGRAMAGTFKDTDGQTVPVPVNDPGVDTSERGAGNYEHAQWGFFFGDVLDAEGTRQHVPLGTFAANRPVDRDTLVAATGIATYTGHAVGNVYNGGAVYTSLGTYRDVFDFGTNKTVGSGRASLDFDEQRYSGNSLINGKGRYQADITGGGRRGALQGQFGGSVNAKGQPGSVVGQFALTNDKADRSEAYHASGTFVGQRR